MMTTHYMRDFEEPVQIMDIQAIRNEKIKKIFKFLESCKLKTRDEDFINSISDFFLSRGYLSDKQYEALLNIYERA